MTTKNIDWLENEHQAIEMEDVEKLLTFLRKNGPKLEDEADKESFEEVTGFLETAKGMASDNKRMTCLYDAATKYANQLAFRLFVEGNLDDETAEIFRAFRTVKEVAQMARAYSEEDKAHADAITALQRDYMTEREEFDIFVAVVGGMSEEEAKQKQEAYKQRQAEGMANAQANGQV